MIGASPLLRPIKGEISHDGRLVRADEALHNLNARAGGGRDEVLGIPALYNLCALAGRLGMRLARTVTVSDQADHLELWVEAMPVGDLVEISILSWRNVGVPLTALRELTNPMVPSDGHSILQFDTSARLIKTNGITVAELTASDFGRQAQEILSKLISDDRILNALIAAITESAAFPPTKATMTGDRRPGMLSGRPMGDPDGNITGYECLFEPSSAAETIDADVPSNAGALIGRHIAPALRQPLDRIIANAETIGMELNGPIRENYAVYARDIANAARHLTELVNDLGDLEAIERVDFSTAPDVIELGDVARRVAGLLSLKAADHSIQIRTPRDDLKIMATAEFRRVLQILLNLVTNAIRYSPNGTEIKIDLAEDHDEVMIHVSDQGSGIGVDDREKIFDKFQRLGRTGDGGSGLGLYISRRLVRAMGGELTVGEAEGGGAKFTLRLPKSL